MRYKLTFAVGFGVGYLLGTKAGRQRYEQIQRAFHGFMDNPTVQETAGVVQAQATDMLHVAKDRVGDRMAHTKVGEKVATRMGMGHHGPDGSSNYPPSAGSNGMP
jgi:hypothetical protein